MNNLNILSDKKFEKIIDDIDKDCKCIVNINLQHSFTDFKGKSHIRTTFNSCKPTSSEIISRYYTPVYTRYDCTYNYSKFYCSYFDHNNILRKIKIAFKFDHILSPTYNKYLMNKIKSIKKRSLITNKSNTIINRFHKILDEYPVDIINYILKFDEGTNLEEILNNYQENSLYYVPKSDNIKDLLFIDKMKFQFNKYNDNESKNRNVFDYIVLTIPVIKRNMNYDQVIEFIKLHIKEINKVIYDLLSLKLKDKGLPVNILDFKNSKMVLTRQFELVFTISVKEIPESIETKGAN